MRKLSTSLLLALLISGCSNVPLLKQSNLEAQDRTEAQAGTSYADAALTLVPAVEIEPQIQALFDQALQSMMEGNQQAASALFLEITEKQPELAGPWVNLSILAESRGDPESAEGYLATALEKNPGNCDALVRLGVRQRKAGEFSSAEQSYRQCLQYRPHHAQASLNLGILYELYMGRYSDALVMYQDYQLAQVEPDPKVDIWMSDLERRVAALARR